MVAAVVVADAKLIAGAKLRHAAALDGNLPSSAVVAVAGVHHRRSVGRMGQMSAVSDYVVAGFRRCT